MIPGRIGYDCFRVEFSRGIKSAGRGKSCQIFEMCAGSDDKGGMDIRRPSEFTFLYIDRLTYRLALAAAPRILSTMLV